MVHRASSVRLQANQANLLHRRKGNLVSTELLGRMDIPSQVRDTSHLPGSRDSFHHKASPRLSLLNTPDL